MRRPVSASGMTRGLGRSLLRGVVAKVLSVAGIPVLLANKVTPTPELSFAVRERKAAGGRDDYVEPQSGGVERREV